MHYAVNEKDALKPCPLCGRPVRMTESRVISGNMFDEYSARIECGCGLTFGKEWVQGRGYRIFIHEDCNTKYEIKLGSDNERTEREIKIGHDLFKLWKNGEFAKGMTMTDEDDR